MKMPDAIPEDMFAVCGMNCLACYKHCAAKTIKQQCPGCLSEKPGKPKHCETCKIKVCASGNGHTRCLKCDDFPCVLVKRLEKSYNTRYGESLISNSLFVRGNGIAAFMESERQNRTCYACGGVVSLHDKICSECGQAISSDEGRVTL
jgi:hypothetical protein